MDVDAVPGNNGDESPGLQLFGFTLNWSTLLKHTLVLIAAFMVALVTSLAFYALVYHFFVPQATHLAPLFFDFTWCVQHAHPSED
jgi:hypothetical protein